MIYYLSSRFANGENICPPAIDLVPCTCTGSGVLGNGNLDCGNKNLNDDLASRILNTFICPQSLSLLYKVNMSNNQLTRIPVQLSTLPELLEVDLHSNKITIIKSGAFNFEKTLNQLILSNNVISTIENGAFQGK